MADHKWLSTLQPGNQVVLHTNYTREVATVSRCTATQVILTRNGHDWRFRKKDGWEVAGDGYNQAYIRQVDPTIIEQIQLENLHRRVLSALKDVRRQDVDTLTQAQCDALLAVLTSTGLRTKKEIDVRTTMAV